MFYPRSPSSQSRPRAAGYRAAILCFGTLLPSAKAASCPQLAEGDIRALAERSGFDVVDGARSQQRGAVG